MEYDPNTFTSEEAALKFYLTQTDGSIRNKLLGITDKEYKCLEAATTWYQSLKGVLSDPNGPEAVQLLEIYNALTWTEYND